MKNNDNEISMSDEIERIAKQYLSVETLATRRSDSLDFHDVAVWSLKSALTAAYMAGASRATQPKKGDA